MITQSGSTGIIPFDNSYARLPERFFSRLPPQPVSAPRLIKLNDALSLELGIDPERLAAPEGVALLAGNAVDAGSEPLAIAYAGHQFGQFVQQLGDGRALLLGEVLDCSGTRRDIQLKGSGPTPFSRRGDGRAALGPVLREYIVSEAMAALGIPTTRSLAAVTTGDTVWRETPLPGAVLTRVALSHIRIGTFQFFAARKDMEGLRVLADYAIARHYPEAATASNPYLAFLGLAISRQAELMAKWMLVGFIHGVMNTDNMSIAGETIDYGPCAFMDNYHPSTVYSSIDAMGRYAYGSQPKIAQWNLTRLAETLLPFFDENLDKAVEQAQAAIDTFPERFEMAYLAGIRRKLGLLEPHPDDLDLARDLFDRMASTKADFTLTFRELCRAAGNQEGDGAVRISADLYEWLHHWRERLAREPEKPGERESIMRSANPAFIPRNHLVEEAISAAQGEGNFDPFEKLVNVLSKPYNDRPGFERYAEPPRPDQIVHQTFCGT